MSQVIYESIYTLYLLREFVNPGPMYILSKLFASEVDQEFSWSGQQAKGD